MLTASYSTLLFYFLQKISQWLIVIVRLSSHFCKDKGSCSDMAGNDREVKPIAQKGKVKKSGATQLDAECYTKTMPRPWQVADHFGGAQINYV